MGKSLGKDQENNGDGETFYYGMTLYC